MKGKIILLISVLFFLGFGFCKGQINWQWVVQSKDSTIQDGGVVAVDKNNNVYLSGGFEATLTQNTLIFGKDSITTPFAQDFLAKFDPNGKVIWLRTSRLNSANSTSWGGALTTDNHSNVYEAGGMTDTLFFGTQMLVGNMFLVKFDSNGKVLWANAETGPAPNSLATDSYNNVYMSGYYNDTAYYGTHKLIPYSYYNIFLVKYDSSGNLKWATQAVADSGASDDFSYSVFTDKNNQVYITGYSTSARLRFGSKVLIKPGAFLAKYDSSGNAIWAKTLWQGWAAAGTINSSNHIYITGGFMDTVIVGKDTLRSNNRGSLSVIKCDTTGNIIWAKQSKPINFRTQSGGAAIASDNCDNVVVAGACTPATITVDTLTLTTIIEPLGSADETFLIKFDSAGSPLGGQAFPNGGDDYMYLATDNYNNIIYGLDLGYENMILGSDTVYMQSSVESEAAIKFSIGTSCNSIETSVGTIRKINEIKVFPNPSNGQFTLSLSNFSEKFNVEIYNIMGQKVYSQLSTFNSQVSINLSSQPNGVYLYRVITENGGLVGEGKTVIEK